jgi:hypothetical protein
MTFTALPLEIVERIIALSTTSDEEVNEEEERSVGALSCANRRLREMCGPVRWRVRLCLRASASLAVQLNSYIMPAIRFHRLKQQLRQVFC